MRRENKYETNKTVRFCNRYFQTSFYSYSSEQLSINKRNRWKVFHLLKHYTQSLDYANKLVLRCNFNFYQYNGYKHELRENPPKHLSFACRPDFIYQPYANFIKVNQDAFSLALCHGWKFLKTNNNLEHLFDVSTRNIPVALIYFLDGPKHSYSSDWINAYKHAFGGYFADYCMVCSGDYCPFGPKIRGQQTLDSRINQVFFISEQNKQLRRCGNCSCGHWKRSTKCDRHEYKRERSRVKIQRRERHLLTKQISKNEILY